MKGQDDEEVFHKDIPYNSDSNQVDQNAVLFEKCFLPLKGKVKLLDELLSHDSKNPRQRILEEMVGER